MIKRFSVWVIGGPIGMRATPLRFAPDGAPLGGP